MATDPSIRQDCHSVDEDNDYISDESPITIDHDNEPSIDEVCDYDILTEVLPLRPGSDLCSKIMFQEPYIKDIIVSSVIGNGITGEAYRSSFTEMSDGSRADFIYTPVHELATDLPAIIIETQKKLNQSFTSRGIRYCLEMLDRRKSAPILIVFNIDGFSSRAYRDSIYRKQRGLPFYNTDCSPWAKEVRVYNSDSIACHLESPIQPIIALAHLLIQQKQCIMALDEYRDPILQSIYKVAFEALSFGKDQIIAKDAKVEHFCHILKQQFEKITHCNQKTTGNRKIDQYAEDGVQIVNAFRRLYVSPEEAPVTFVTADNQDTSPDLQFVNEYRVKSSGRFIWLTCFNEGRTGGYFSRFSSHVTLKKAYHRNTL